MILLWDLQSNITGKIFTNNAMPPLKQVKGIDVKQISKVSNIVHHVKDPIRYPKVQCGYEGLAQVIFSTQTNNILNELTKEMINILER